MFRIVIVLHVDPSDTVEVECNDAAETAGGAGFS